MVKAVVMPKLGTTMKEGMLAKWHKEVGDYVEQGELLLTIESNKADVEVESTASGYLVKILHDEGETLPVAVPIGVIASSMDEDISSVTGAESIEADKDTAETTADTAAPETDNTKVRSCKIAATPKARALAKRNGVDLSAVSGTGKNGMITDEDVQKAMDGSSTKASPVAKKIAEQNDVSLSDTKGSGARGKVMKQDVESVIAGRSTGCRGEDQIVAFGGMRKVIADNMMKSVHGMAHAYHKMKVNMTEAIRLRESLKSDGIKVSFTDIIAKAVSKALMEYPAVNASLCEEGIRLKNYVNIGLAVALDNGLIVPNVKNAHMKSLEEISKEAKDLIDKAREGKLSPGEYTGGTFTITNLGMYDMDEFLAIINPPEAGILAIGKIEDTPVGEAGQIILRPIMIMTLTYDHRIVDGAPAAMFLRRIKQILEMPYLLI